MLQVAPNVVRSALAIKMGDRDFHSQRKETSHGNSVKLKPPKIPKEVSQTEQATHKIAEGLQRMNRG